jgi:hypothetical protein
MTELLNPDEVAPSITSAQKEAVTATMFGAGSSLMSVASNIDLRVQSAYLARVMTAKNIGIVKTAMRTPLLIGGGVSGINTAVRLGEILMKEWADDHGRNKSTEHAYPSSQPSVVYTEVVTPSQSTVQSARNPYRAIKATLETSFARSRPMLEWADDWDENGSPAIQQATWDRMQKLLEQAVQQLFFVSGRSVDAPVISPGPEGSIDVHWRLQDRELAINVPPSNNLATFYGDNMRGEKIKGQLDVEADQQWLLEWLAR